MNFVEIALMQQALSEGRFRVSEREFDYCLKFKAHGVWFTAATIHKSDLKHKLKVVA